MHAIQLTESAVASDLAPDAFAIGDYGLIVTGKPTYEQWVQIGRNLWTQKQKIQWNIGDWINHGEACYGEKYVQALRETDYTLQTLENYASVARKVPVEQRRKNISFSMYQEVAPLPLPERETLLDGVEMGIVSRQDVRDYKRERREKAQAIQPTASVTDDSKVIPLTPRALTIIPEAIMHDGRLRYVFPENLPAWIFGQPMTIYVETKAA